MNPYLSVAALLFTTSLLFALPLIPAFLELYRKSDALPLDMILQNAGDIRYFAQSFRVYIEALQPLLQRSALSGATASGTLPDGEKYVVVGPIDAPLVLALPHPVVVAAGADLTTPSEVTFARDLYVAGEFHGGKKNTFRAILGEHDVHLGVSTSVMRWVHAVGELTADLGTTLYGRASSDSRIHLQAECSFVRLNAPRIEIGAAEFSLPHSSMPAIANSTKSPRFFHDGDFEIQSGQVIHTDIVIRGQLLIRSGARICGSVKSDQDLLVEDGVSVEGSLISARKVRIGPRCHIHGPVIAERALSIATGVHCGTFERPTTVSAPHIEIENGAVVFGTLWARELGRVVINA